MTFTLPDLPYPHDALQPFMSRETLEFHHDKHHAAYVNTGNNLLKGTDLEGKSVEEVVKASYGKNQALFNNAGQHYNHIHFWMWMKPIRIALYGRFMIASIGKCSCMTTARSRSLRITNLMITRL